MKVMLKKIKVCDTERLQLNCPECKSLITLDLETFSNNPVEIICYKCSQSFLVLEIDTKKRGSLFLSITKDKGKK